MDGLTVHCVILTHHCEYYIVVISLVSCAIWNPRRTLTAFVTQKLLNGVDLNILRNNIGKNTVVSSFAFRLPLCKLAAAAVGNTRHEIISVLGFTSVSQTKDCYSSLFPALAPLLETDLTILNKIYINYTDAIDNNFILGSEAYGVTVSKIGYDFRKDAVAYVNREFKSKTYMRIQDILKLDDINENSSILLVNGIHYKGTWESPFTRAYTQNKQFRSGKKTLTVEMMHKMAQCLFLNDADAMFKIISLRLSQFGMYMTFVLPYRNSSIIQLLDTMSQRPKFIENVHKTMQWKFVDISLPKFKIKKGLDWTQYLKQIGLNLTTNMENTGLRDILKDKDDGPNMYVSKALQKVFVEVAEGPLRNMYGFFEETPLVRSGLEPPATSAVNLEDFTVDGPFYFAVTLSVRSTRRKKKNVEKQFRILDGVYYGPE